MKLKLLKYNKISKLIFILFLFLNIIIKFDKQNIFKFKKKIKILKYFYKLNNKGILINRSNFTKKDYPKVSIISAVYNREKYIIRFFRSIQNQFFDDIEMIFIDDFSNDNSSKIIENLKSFDERIILIKNKKNKGTLFSRNIGALKAKGEYLIFPDPDDILLPGILKACYDSSKTYNYDLIRFNMLSDKFFIFGEFDNNLKKNIYQPELRTYLIYGYGYQKLVDGIISNKFIQKSLFLITLNDINNYFLNQNMIYFEDGLINYALHLNAKSLYLLNHMGYYYIYNQDSASRSIKMDSYLRCFFIYLKFFIEKTKNNEYERKIIIFILKEYINQINILKTISNYSHIYDEVIDSMMKIKFINNENKEKIKGYKKIINLILTLLPS